MKIFLSVAALLAALQLSSGKIFSKCELARELQGHGFPADQLNQWVCLVDAESSFNTAAVGGPNLDGSKDWGLFQINDRYWCSPGYPGKECRLDCRSLLSDDISLAVGCVRKIFAVHGFSAWTGWVLKCQGNLPDLTSCGIE